jgi:hypothetical protein
MQKVADVFRSGCHDNPSSCGPSQDHSGEVQGTNEHATMLASRQHMNLLFRDGQKECRSCMQSWRYRR